MCKAVPPHWPIPSISACLSTVLISKNIVSCSPLLLSVSTIDFLQVDMSQIGLHLLISRSRASKDMANSDIKMSGIGQYKVWPVDLWLALHLTNVIVGVPDNVGRPTL